VAGVAKFKSSTSNKKEKVAGSLIRYPFDRQSILFSSRAEFRFSIQIGSTGPSSVSQNYISISCKSTLFFFHHLFHCFRNYSIEPFIGHIVYKTIQILILHCLGIYSPHFNLIYLSLRILVEQII